MKQDIESCANILDCEKKNIFDLKLAHRILILAGYYVSEEEVLSYMDSISKNTLTLNELKEYCTKNKFRNPPQDNNIMNLFQLLNMGNSNQIDIDLLKYGLTSVGKDKFSNLELEDFFEKLDINISEEKQVSIDKLLRNLNGMLSVYK